MKYVAGHPETKRALSTWAAPRKAIIASHYFWCAGTPIQKSQQGLWQSLLFGILSNIPDAIPEVCQERWQLKPAQPKRVSSQDTWGARELQSCFSRLAKRDFRKTRFCVFDGLDEFDGDHLDIVHTLVELSQSPMIKLCVSSRPWNVFEMNLGRSPPSKIYIHELTRDDILRYSESRLAEHPRWAIEVGPADADLLVKDITDRAQGVFLWVFLVTKLLRDGLTNYDTPSDIRRMLDSILPDLEEFFKQILDSVPRVYHEKMAGFLVMTLAAEEPLHASIYHFHEREYGDAGYAMSEKVSPRSQEDTQGVINRVRRRLDALCKGLLEVGDEDSVQYIHRTVKDWLETRAMRDYLKSKLRPGFDPHFSMLRASLAVYKHPEVGALVNINMVDFRWSGSVVDQLEDITSYAKNAQILGQAHITNEVYRILDETSSVTVDIFRTGLVAFDERWQGLPQADCVLMCRSMMVRSVCCYVLHKAQETPDYLTPLVRCHTAIAPSYWDDSKNLPEAMRSSRLKLATILLQLVFDEYFPEDIVDPDGKLFHPNECKYEDVLDLFDILAGIMVNGAVAGVIIWTTADSLQIPAWLVLFLLNFKMIPAITKGTVDDQKLYFDVKDVLDHISANALASSFKAGRAMWAILCKHISALRGGLKADDNVPCEGSVIQDDAKQKILESLYILATILLMLVDQLVRGYGSEDLPWRDLQAAIEEGLPQHLAEPILDELVVRRFITRKGTPNQRGVHAASVVSSAVPQARCLSVSRKRHLAELPASESTKRTRRCSF